MYANWGLWEGGFVRNFEAWGIWREKWGFHYNFLIRKFKHVFIWNVAELGVVFLLLWIWEQRWDISKLFMLEVVLLLSVSCEMTNFLRYSLLSYSILFFGQTKKKKKNSNLCLSHGKSCFCTVILAARWGLMCIFTFIQVTLPLYLYYLGQIVNI